MTLDEIDRSLPNGFHDAFIYSVALDYERREAQIRLDIWIAESDAPKQRELYRRAELHLHGLLFWISELPDANANDDGKGPLWVDIVRQDRLDKKAIKGLPLVPQNQFVNGIFVRNWNAFIYLAAQSAKLNWVGTARLLEYKKDKCVTDDEQAIRAFVDDWFAASKSGDVDAILKLMDDDAVFMSPGAEPFGRDAFKAAAAQMKNMQLDMKSDILEIKVLGDWAFFRSRLQLSITPPGAKTLTRAGHTLTILRRKDGRWVLSRDANMLA